MTQYTTQMDAARKGIVTPQIKTVAEKEHMPVEKMMQLVAEGKPKIFVHCMVNIPTVPPPRIATYSPPW